MKNALIEQDHVSGLGRPRHTQAAEDFSQARGANPADSLAELLVMRTRDHAERTAVGSDRFEVSEKPHTPERTSESVCQGVSP